MNTAVYARALRLRDALQREGSDTIPVLLADGRVGGLRCVDTPPTAVTVWMPLFVRTGSLDPAGIPEYRLAGEDLISVPLDDLLMETDGESEGALVERGAPPLPVGLPLGHPRGPFSVDWHRRRGLTIRTLQRCEK